MCSDNALLMPVSPRLILTSKKKKAEPLVVEKLTLKIFPSYTALFSVILGYLKQRNGPNFNRQP